MVPPPDREDIDTISLVVLTGAYGWSVVNALGQTVATGMANGTTRLPLVGLKAGRYVLCVEQEGQRIRRPVLID